jgi:hypothetical protein
MYRHLELDLDELPVLPQVVGQDGRNHDLHLFAHGSADVIYDDAGNWHVGAIYLETSEPLPLAGARLSRRFASLAPETVQWRLVEAAIRARLGDQVEADIGEKLAETIPGARITPE